MANGMVQWNSELMNYEFRLLSGDPRVSPNPDDYIQSEQLESRSVLSDYLVIRQDISLEKLKLL